MNCPKCTQSMEDGVATVEGTVGGFLIAGMSCQHLFFKGDKNKKVIPSNETVSAFRCHGCGITVVEDETHMSQAFETAGRKLGQKYKQWKNRRDSKIQ